jgi:TonB family protein
MSTGTTPALSPETTPQRKVPRFKLAVPADLTVLRSGIPDHIPGRTLTIGEGGVGVVVASRLLLGESVRVEFLLPHMTTPVRATAVVRYENDRSFGLQFLRLPEEHKSIIRYWTRCEGDVLLSGRKPLHSQSTALLEENVAEPAPLFQDAQLFRTLEGSAPSRRSSTFHRMLNFAIPAIVLVAALAWWQWEQGWSKLEAPVLAKESAAAKPQLKVPAEVMQQRIRHKVMPDYPDAARQANVQGTVLLDAVVSAEGAVTQLKVLSGPEPLTRAATDAVRWWRYEPYIVNGQPVPVETTVVMDFRLSN